MSTATNDDSVRWCLLTLVIASFLSVMCNGQMLGVERLAFQWMQHQSWSKFEDLLVNKTENIGVIADVSGQLLGLIRDLKLSPYLKAVSAGVNVSQQCIEDSIFYIESLFFNRSNWALQMMESSAQFPAGIIGSGNFHAEGLFDECLAIRAPGRFRGQYCSVYLKPTPVEHSDIISDDSTDENRLSPILDYLLRRLFGPSLSTDRVEPKTSGADALNYMLPSFSLCLPSSCSASDLGQSVAQLIGSYVIANQSIVIITDESYCFTQDDQDPHPSFDGADIAVIVTLSFIGFGVLLATVHDAWRMFRGIEFVSKTDNSFVTALHCFSALSNGRKLLSLTPAATGSDNLSCLHGIRFLSTCWVVLGHTWLKSATSNVANPKMVAQQAMSWQMETIINATVSVDSFFLMSGLLISYLLLRELDRNSGKFNLGLLYLHRYLRLTPVYAIILGYIATLMIYLGTGPNWYNVVVASEGCRITWWKQFLYINNLFPSDFNVQCMGETWYLAVDMQLFLIAPLFIYPLWRWKKAGLALLVVFTLAALAANFAVYAIFSFPPSLMPTRMNEMMRVTTSYMDNYYFKPWIRAPPYFVGMWTGWYLHRIKQSKLHVPQWAVVLLWALSAAIGISIIYGLTPYLDETMVPTIDWVVKLMYGPLHRAAWALVLAWVIVACIHGYGGFVDRLLSWRGFLPLSRLTYCVYLIHYDYLNIYYSLNRRMIYYTFIGQLTEFFGIMVTVFGLAFLVSIFVEASFINLEQWIFSSAAPSKNKGSEETDGNATKATDEARAEDVENIDGNVNAAFSPEETAAEKQCGTKL